MSSIVVAPTRRAENTIYLAFSAVLVIFIQYLGAWISGIDTSPPFAPDLIIVGIIAPIISAALIYSVPDQWLVHNQLSRKIVTAMKIWAEYYLLSSAALQVYKIRSISVRNPKSVFHEERSIVLEGGTLDTPIWRLRGAFWFFISLWLTIPITISIVGLSAFTSIFIITIGIVVSIVVAYPSWKWYIHVSQVLTDSIEFHWLDRVITAARRSDVAIDTPPESRIEIDVKGFTEAIYRGIRGAEDAVESPPEHIIDVPEVVKPSKRGTRHGDEKPVKVTGRISSSTKSEISDKALQDLITGEVEWLRELIRRTIWSSFRARFSELRRYLLLRGEASVKLIRDPILEEWRQSLRAKQANHSFTNLRRLCYYLRGYDLIPSADQQTIDEIIEYEESFMVDPVWASNLYFKRMTRRTDITGMFQLVASDHVDDYLEQMERSALDQYVGQDIAYYEQEYEKLAGEQLWPEMNDDELDKAEPMTYD